MSETQAPFWSWRLGMITLWMPAKHGIEETLLGKDGKLVALATIDRDAANYRHLQVAEDLGRKVAITGTEREVVHTGGQLPLRGKSIYLADVLDAFLACPLGFWGRVAEEPGKGTKVEIRLGEPREGTTGVLPLGALLAFVTALRERAVSVRAVWVNPSAEGQFSANLVVSTPEERKLTLVSADELFVFDRDGMPRLGSRLYKPHQPRY